MNHLNPSKTTIANINQDYITSNINSFETGSFYNTVANQSSYNLLKIHLDNVSSWLDREIIPSIYFILNDIKEYDAEKIEDCKLTVKNIEAKFQQLSNFIKLCKSRNKKDNYTFICTKCSIPIPISGTANYIWPILQNHRHIEESLALGISRQYDRNCEKCGYKYSSNFKFNFPISYNPSIIKKFYIYNNASVPNDEEYGLPVILVESRSSCTCLLCPVKIPVNGTFRNIFQHLNGQKHLKNKCNKVLLYNFSAYHENWMKVELNFQAHQCYFLPSGSNETLCLLCCKLVKYGSIEEHITTVTHKKLFLRLGTHRTSLQLSVYSDEEDTSNLSSLATGLVQRSDKTLTNSNMNTTKKYNGNNLPLHKFVKSVLCPTGPELHDILEYRFYAHIPLFTVLDNDLLECTCCGIKIPKHPIDIKNHVLNDEHMSKCNVKSVEYSYYCDVCHLPAKQESQWINHLIHDIHKQRCDHLGKNRRIKLTEYHCLDCQLILFGDELSMKRHQTVIRKAVRKETVLPDTIKALFKSELHINSLCHKLVNEANEVLVNREPMLFCCSALETVLSEIFGRCKSYPFGSRVSGLGNKSSDLDLYIDVGGMYTGLKGQNAKAQEKFVWNASTALRKRKEEFTHVNPIPSARTPIVQVYHVPSNIDCDISFRHGLSVENTKFLRLCMNVQPIMQPLVLILKQWSSKCELEHITTYALSMMVIFFLQTKFYLLPVKELMFQYLGNLLDIDGWKIPDFSISATSVYSKTTPYKGTVKELLIEFFNYYKDFNYADDVICPLIGTPIKKSLFLEKPDGEALPIEMFTYVSKLKDNAKMDLFRCHSPLCIQDPFDLSHNLTKACGQHVVNNLKSLCNLSTEFLKNIPKV